MTSHRIAPIPGYTPTIGRLVGMLSYSRETLLAAVDGLSRDELDHLHDAASNSIGALVAHVGAVERWYQILTFEGREPSAGDLKPWRPGARPRGRGAAAAPRSGARNVRGRPGPHPRRNPRVARSA